MVIIELGEVMVGRNLFSIRNVAFVILFFVLIVLANRIPVFNIYTANPETGELQKMTNSFTAIQFFAPIAGGLLQSTAGIAVVFLSQLASLIINGAPLDLVNITRLFMLVFAAYYFGRIKESSWIAFVPLITVIVFAATTAPEAWHYALIWFIPLVCALPKLRGVVFARALGATFTAHALGNLWFTVFFGLQPAAFWIALFPVTLIERIAMAAGITVFYIAVNTVLSRYFADVPILNIEKKYALF